MWSRLKSSLNSKPSELALAEVEPTEDQGTTVRVAVRVRPLSAQEQISGSRACLLTDAATKTIALGSRRFTFDHVFGHQSRQGDIFQQCVVGLADGCFEGYNATVFAYGQTGSGKTFTMHGMGSSSEASMEGNEQGVIPRVIRYLFDNVAARLSTARFAIRIQFLEIYNEEVKDLLHPDTPAKHIAIRETAEGEILVAGAREEVVGSYDDAMRLLDVGSLARSTGSTRMNEQSSRSHAIFTIVLEQFRKANELTCSDGSDYMIAKFHLVDLAGSERAKKTGAAGLRLKESTNINSGLLSLGNVISALGDPKRKATHVNYRDSKLTRLLQDSLGGNSRTCMLACVTASDSHIEESLNTLKYANRARNIRNKPIVNHEKGPKLAGMQKELEQLQMLLIRRHLDNPADGLSSLARLADLTSSEATPDIIDRLQHLAAEGDQAGADPSTSGEMAQLQAELASARQEAELLRAEVDRLNATLQQQEPAAAAQQGAQAGPDQGPGPARQVAAVNASASLSALQKLAGRRYAQRSAVDQAAPDSASMQLLQEAVQQAQAKIGELAGAMAAKEGALAKYKSLLAEAQADLARDEVVFAAKLRDIKQLKALNAALQTQLQEQEAGHAAQLADLHHCLQSASNRQAPQEAAQVEGNVRSILASPASPARAILDEDNDEVVFDNGMSGADSEATAPADDTTNAQRSALDVEEEESTSQTYAALEQLEQDKRDLEEQAAAERRQFQATSHALNSQLRELAYNIQNQEALIIELQQNEQESKQLSQQYLERLQELEAQVAERERELARLRSEMEAMEASRSSSVEEKRRMRAQYEDKIGRVQSQMSLLKRQLQQQQSVKVEKERARAALRIKALEQELARMRCQQESLHHKVRTAAQNYEKECEGRAREVAGLRKASDASSKRVRQLEHELDLKASIIKRKHEETAALQRKLKGLSFNEDKAHAYGNVHGLRSRPPTPRPLGRTKPDVQRTKAALDRELAVLVKARAAEAQLEQLRSKHAQLQASREEHAGQRAQLELRRIRASQAADARAAELGDAISELQEEAACRQREADAGDARAAAEVLALEQQVAQTQEQLRAVQACLATGAGLLDEADEAAAAELDDAIDADDMHLEYTASAITQCTKALSAATTAGEAMQMHTEALSGSDAKKLLQQYLDSLILERDKQRHHSYQAARLEVERAEAQGEAEALEARCRMTHLECERRVTALQREHAKKTAGLLRQMAALSQPSGMHAEAGSRRESGEAEVGGDLGALQSTDLRRLAKYYKEQAESLSRDVFYHKQVNRDLKRRLRGEQPDQGGDESVDTVLSELPNQQPANQMQLVRVSRSSLQPLTQAQVHVLKQSAAQWINHAHAENNPHNYGPS
ncbi:hypothetical protein WJX72_002799 [[Myrmecia] bisecta]|uniref:Kinesin motor domain-containing protein n=1 Tax=[Myrmecia] bisecta TaxID=41462 RepID=A0AAW1PZL1_9CHLO